MKTTDLVQFLDNLLNIKEIQDDSQNGLQVENRDVSDVINALKAKSILKGPQGKVASSYVSVRNKAFHAEWGKIDVPEVKSLISLTEQLLLKHLSDTEE